LSGLIVKPSKAQHGAFNVTNRVNNLTRNANFGPGAYPTNPSSMFNQITAGGEARTLQFAVRFTF
jgi:hypothetical protein